MQGIVKEERGAALVTVMLFMVLSFIFISATFATTQNEIVIAGLHRDGVLAMELAQAGIQEAIARIHQGRPYLGGFTSSLNPGVTVTVARQALGTNSAYLEIQATATVGRTTRRVSALVLLTSFLFPPSITLAESVTEDGNGAITAGDAYARTFFAYKKAPTPDLTYAGWYISKASPGQVDPCYTHAACADAGQQNWYPGTRRAEPQASPLGKDIKDQTYKCPAGGGGPLLADTITGILQNDPQKRTVTVSAYGFDTDTNNGQDLAVSSALPCGLPYKYVAQQKDGDNFLFKTIVYEQWLNAYWGFDEARLAYVKKATLVTNPQFGAIPPFPNYSTLAGNYDQVYPGGTITTNLGTPTAPLVIFLLGDSHIAGQVTGAGTLVALGSLQIDGQFSYYGQVIVSGTFVAGSGNANITGGLAAKNTLVLAGNFSITGGTMVPSMPVGPTLAAARSWWER